MKLSILLVFKYFFIFFLIVLNKNFFFCINTNFWQIFSMHANYVKIESLIIKILLIHVCGNYM